VDFDSLHIEFITRDARSQRSRYREEILAKLVIWYCADAAILSSLILNLAFLSLSLFLFSLFSASLTTDVHVKLVSLRARSVLKNRIGVSLPINATTIPDSPENFRSGCQAFTRADVEDCCKIYDVGRSPVCLTRRTTARTNYTAHNRQEASKGCCGLDSCGHMLSALLPFLVRIERRLLKSAFPSMVLHRSLTIQLRKFLDSSERLEILLQRGVSGSPCVTLIKIKVASRKFDVIYSQTIDRSLIVSSDGNVVGVNAELFLCVSGALFTRRPRRSKADHATRIKI